MKTNSHLWKQYNFTVPFCLAAAAITAKPNFWNDIVIVVDQSWYFLKGWQQSFHDVKELGFKSYFFYKIFRLKLIFNDTI